MRKLGRNDRCYCGSGAKFKKCHGPIERSTVPLPTEDALIAAFKHGTNRSARDPRELAAILANAKKPVLIIDEKRIDDRGPPFFVFFSVVALPATVALGALGSIWKACRLAPRAAKFSGPRLLADQGTDAAALRRALEEPLKYAQVYRAGITYESMRAWRQESRWPGVTTIQTGIHIKQTEYVVLLSLAEDCVPRLNLHGLGMMIVDRSTQNGLDSSLHNLGDDEIAAITFDVPNTDCHMMILATTPEDDTAGPWIRLPDYDAARATKVAGFAEFARRVQTAPVDGTMIYWNHSFQRWE